MNANPNPESPYVNLAYMQEAAGIQNFQDVWHLIAQERLQYKRVEWEEEAFCSYGPTSMMDEASGIIKEEHNDFYIVLRDDTNKLFRIQKTAIVNISNS